MQGNIYNPQELAAIKTRLQNLNENSPRQWGTMTASQMLCHCSDQLRMGLGEKELYPNANFFNRVILKWIIFKFSFAKNSPTIPELDKDKKGTVAKDFAYEKAALFSLLDRFVAKDTLVTHPFFGDMPKDEWGHLAHKHLDHHFRQFAV